MKLLTAAKKYISMPLRGRTTTTKKPGITLFFPYFSLFLLEILVFFRELREKISKDKHNFYTYSEKHLTLSIDPHSIEDAKRFEETLEKTKLA